MNVHLCYAITRVMTRMGIPETSERAKWVEEIAQRSLIRNGELVISGPDGDYTYPLKVG